MKFWFVNMNKHYDEQIKESCLWTPKDSNVERKAWNRLKEIAKGDLILCNNQGLITAVGIVKDKVVEENTNKEGQKIQKRNIEFIEIDKNKIIKYGDYKKEIQKYDSDAEGPFNKKGDAKQEFLSPINDDLAKFFINKIDDEDINNLLSRDGETNNKLRKNTGYNKIYFGVPGVGKSHTIKKNLKEVDKENKFRITFHPEFTYSDFIGQIMPTIKKIDDDKEEITYEFQEGEFTKALKRAYANPETNIYLILEEMSRGNCAAIFGDIFQLLDRDRKTNWSEFYINNDLIANKVLEEVKKENIEKYALEELKKGKIRIPSNMYILGTVNTSDQNVFAMDTAFKRRFEWEYIDTSPKDEDEKKDKIFNEIDMKIIFDDKDDKDDISIKWSVFYRKLNKFISGKDYLGLGDDKQIGQAFIKFKEDDNKENEKKIRNKLLNYLWFDVEQVSYKSEIRLFKEYISNFSELYEESKLKDEESAITRINGTIFNEKFLNILTINKK